MMKVVWLLSFSSWTLHLLKEYPLINNKNLKKQTAYGKRLKKLIAASTSQTITLRDINLYS